MKTIDVLKLFFSFCVVAIHTNLLGEVPEEIEWVIMHLIFRIAVPFFFIVSGFFLGRKLNNDEKNQKEIFHNYRKKLIPPLCVWGGFGLLIYVYTSLRHNENLVDICWNTIKRALFYPQGAMWFVAACIVSSVILEFAISHKWKKIFVTVLGVLLFAFALITNTYYFIIEGTPIQNIVDCYMNIFVSARNGICLFIYLWLGYLLSLKQTSDFLDKHRKGVHVTFAFSVVALVIEVLYTYGKNVADDSSLFISFLVFIPLMVYEALNIELKADLPYREMRAMSGVVYYTHKFVNAVVGIYQFWGFIIVCTICIIIYFLTRNSTNKFIRSIL